MLETVIKRSGRKQEFDKRKIEQAIFKAIMGTRTDIQEEKVKELSALATDVVVFKLSEKDKAVVHLEEIQNIVEETLMNLGMTDVARNYVRYRFQRELLRKDKETGVSVEKMMSNYIKKDDWLVKENANMDYSLQGLNNYIVSDITKNFWLNHIFTKEQKEAHQKGDIHIHDLGLLAPYCCGWDMEDLLLNGFTGVKNKAQTKPAKHLKTALGQLVNFFYTLQGEAAGAQAISSLDTYVAPFIRHDNLTYKEVKQNVQEFVFNLSVPTRVGFQTPFVNITLDLTPSPLLKDKPVIIGGEYQNETYGEFQKEMDMFNKAFCEVMVEGDASGRVFTFPIPTYNITSDFDWDSEVAHEIMKMTSKYGIPYFSNFINSDMKPEDARSMCCRLRLDNRELRKRGGGLFGANPLTGSIGVITINLPRLGYLYKTETEFKERLRKMMDIARDILNIKRKVIEKNTKDNLYPYSKFYLRAVYERFGEYWKNHFNTIGLIGMNECIRNFYNDTEDITTEKGQKFALKIMDYMREVITEYQESGDLYNLEATPGEGTTYRLAKLDKAQFPDIITAGKNEPYYTNSTQLPVDYTTDLFEVLKLQDELQTKYTGGTVLHGYLGERIHDPEVTKNLIKTVFENYRLPYFSITPTFSTCDEHGYIAGEQFKCPNCGRDTEVWTRVVGFYRPVQAFNNGKFEEFKERLEYVVQ
ncbi:MAG TPA: ribonucleoside triphosphate reductase [Mollicutes bacterium]|nr:ribonucleoside triphosphate reductase [Mollicutes bacterium]